MKLLILNQLYPLLALSATCHAFTTVETTGPYATGVRDFDFTDNTYPLDWHPNDASGRRLMFRMHYPVCEKTNLAIVDVVNGNSTTTTGTCNGVPLGSRRKYLESQEWEVYFGIPEPESIAQLFDRTQSYVNAPIALDDPKPTFPVVIYSHGFGSWVSDNTALVEEIASHGYIVCAVASPGFASGVIYPSDGRFVTARDDYPDVMAAVQNDAVPNPYLANFTDNLQIRYDRMELYLHEGVIPVLVQRLNDDLMAVADYLNAIAHQSPIEPSTVTSSQAEKTQQEVDPFLLDLLGDYSDGLNGKLAYMGFSLGGSAAGSAAHADGRAVGAINLDGGHQSLDVWNSEIRTPYLTFFEQTELAWFYHGEFLFENLFSMGTRADIIRVLGPEGVQHNDYTDQKLFSPELRAGLLGITTPVDGLRMHSVLSEFTLAFLGRFLRGETAWDPQTTFEKFEGIEPVDVSYVAEWAHKNFATTTPTMDEDSSAPFSSLSVGAALFASILAAFLIGSFG